MKTKRTKRVLGYAPANQVSTDDLLERRAELHELLKRGGKLSKAKVARLDEIETALQLRVDLIKESPKGRRSKTAELLTAFQRAVTAREQMWDAERDIELLLGHDVNKLDELIDIYAVAGAEGMGRDSVRSLREYAEENRADYKPTNYFSGKTGKVVKTL